MSTFQPQLPEGTQLPSITSVTNFNLTQDDIEAAAETLKDRTKGHPLQNLVEAEETNFEGEETDG